MLILLVKIAKKAKTKDGICCATSAGKIKMGCLRFKRQPFVMANKLKSSVDNRCSTMTLLSFSVTSINKTLICRIL